MSSEDLQQALAEVMVERDRLRTQVRNLTSERRTLSSAYANLSEHAQISTAAPAMIHTAGNPQAEAELLFLTSLAPKWLVRLARDRETVLQTPWEKTMLRSPLNVGKWLAVRRIQRRARKNKRLMQKLKG